MRLVTGHFWLVLKPVKFLKERRRLNGSAVIADMFTKVKRPLKIVRHVSILKSILSQRKITISKGNKPIFADYF